VKNQASQDEAPAPEKPFAGLVRGRIVHYYPLAHECRYSLPGPWASIVTNVLNEEDGLVTLNTMPPQPASIGTDPVLRVTPISYSPDGAPGCWSWMFPGQATRYSPDRK